MNKPLVDETDTDAKSVERKRRNSILLHKGVSMRSMASDSNTMYESDKFSMSSHPPGVNTFPPPPELDYSKRRPTMGRAGSVYVPPPPYDSEGEPDDPPPPMDPPSNDFNAFGVGPVRRGTVITTSRRPPPPPPSLPSNRESAPKSIKPRF